MLDYWNLGYLILFRILENKIKNFEIKYTINSFYWDNISINIIDNNSTLEIKYTINSFYWDNIDILLCINIYITIIKYISKQNSIIFYWY